MRTLSIGISLLGAALALRPVIAQPAAEAAPTSSSQAGDPANGQRLYFQTACYTCHGTIGHGAFLAGPKLTPPLIPYAAFSAQLREPARRMPRYSEETMSEQEVADIYAYLQAIPVQPTADAIDILKD